MNRSTSAVRSAIRLLIEQREVQDDEDVVVVLVELGPIVARVHVLVVERVEVELLLEPLTIGEPGRLDMDPPDALRPRSTSGFATSSGTVSPAPD